MEELELLEGPVADDELSYLEIENEGVFGIDLLRVSGASASRGRKDMIGQFGTGSKIGIAAILRDIEDATPDIKIFIGEKGYTFITQQIKSEDGMGRNVFIQEIVMKQFRGESGGQPKLTKMGIDLSLGGIHWKNSAMGAREFICNAADAAWDRYADYSKMTLRVVTPDRVKPKEGHTRVYIRMTPTINAYYEALTQFFMIFDKDYDGSIEVMDKRRPGSGLSVFRRGVQVGTSDMVSLFDYNFADIAVNEDRTITADDARAAVGKSLKNASYDRLVRFFQAVHNGEQVFEVDQVDPYYLTLQYNDSDEVKERWNKAFAEVFGVNGVLVDGAVSSGMVQRKGYTPVSVAGGLKSALASYGVKTSEKVLSLTEQSGHEQFELSIEHRGKVVEIWNMLATADLVGDKPMPVVEGFKVVMDGASKRLGNFSFSRNVVTISADAFDGDPVVLVSTLVENFGKYVTNSHDAYRLTDWLARVAGCMMAFTIHLANGKPLSALPVPAAIV
jgi:hypothetical protein